MTKRKSKIYNLAAVQKRARILFDNRLNVVLVSVCRRIVLYGFALSQCLFAWLYKRVPQLSQCFSFTFVQVLFPVFVCSNEDRAENTLAFHFG